MAAQLQLVPLFHREGAAGKILPGESGQHGKRLRVAHNRHFGILFRQRRNASRVVGLHVVDNQIIRFSARQRLFQVGPPRIHYLRTTLYPVQHRNFFI